VSERHSLALARELPWRDLSLGHQRLAVSLPLLEVTELAPIGPACVAFLSATYTPRWDIRRPG